MAKKCANCSAIPQWSFSENIVAFCPVTQKYVTVSDGCEEPAKKAPAKKEPAKKATAKKAPVKKAAK